ncbi:hypothetical protein ACLM5H_15815 [Fredinandcohnia humi]
MLPLARAGYTEQEVKDVLHGKYSPRFLNFRYHLLDRNDKKIGELDTVESGEVSMASLNSIKRTGRFKIKDKGEINWLTDRMQPHALLRMNDGKFIEFPLGIFLLSSPIREDKNKNIYRDVEAFDGLLILRDDKFESRYSVTAGTNYRAAVIDILTSAGITKHNIEQTEKVLPVDMEFEPGREKLYAINELLRAINFTQIYVDVYGYFTSQAYRSPSVRPSEYTYADDKLSITYPGMREELDLFNVPNKWVVVLSNPELEPLVASYTNENPDSPSSTVRRGRTIVDYREIDNIADQKSLDAYVQRIAFEASQVYGKLEFETAINPAHDFSDVIQINYSSLGISGKYSETDWTIPLVAGGKMKHSLRKVVNV